jgi:hypothetical protein
MFFWWVSNTSKATEMANTRYNGFSTLKTTKINMGKAMLAKMELKETKRVRYKTNSANSSSKVNDKKMDVTIFEMFKSNIVTIQLS